MRYLGLIAELSVQRPNLDHLYRLCVIEMISRTVKRILQKDMQQGSYSIIIISQSLHVPLLHSITTQCGHCCGPLLELLSGEYCVIVTPLLCHCTVSPPPQGVPAESTVENIPEEVCVYKCPVVCNVLLVVFSQRRRIRRKGKLLEELVSVRARERRKGRNELLQAHLHNSVGVVHETCDVVLLWLPVQ